MDAATLPKGEKKRRQVFQGRYMREDSSFFDKLFWSYPVPLLESSMKEEVHWTQYGNLHPDYQVQSYVKKLQTSVDYYVSKDKSDRLAFVKGISMANQEALIYAGGFQLLSILQMI